MGLKAVFRKIAGFFKGAAVKTYDAVQDLLASEPAQRLMKDALAGVVEQTVIEVQSLPNLKGWERRGEALARIATRAKQEGIEYKNSIVNLLLEMFVSRLKAAGEELEK